MEMIITIILAVLGIIATIIVTHYYTKKQMAKNQISHFAIQTYNLGRGVKEVFPEFLMMYNGMALEKYTRFCEGRFKNTGNKDIHGNDELGFSLIFPDHYSIKAIDVTATTEELTIRHEIDKERNNIIHFFFKNLLRTGEEFKYSVLLDSSENDNNPFGKLRFSNRIPDTSIQEADVKHIKFYEKISLLGGAMMLLLMFILFWWERTILADTIYKTIFIICFILVNGFTAFALMNTKNYKLS